MTNPPDEIERVARALYQHEWQGQPGMEGEWQASKAYWIDAATAATTAMDQHLREQIAAKDQTAKDVGYLLNKIEARCHAETRQGLLRLVHEAIAALTNTPLGGEG
jgi:hypothetical protein